MPPGFAPDVSHLMLRGSHQLKVKAVSIVAVLCALLAGCASDREDPDTTSPPADPTCGMITPATLEIITAGHKPSSTGDIGTPAERRFVPRYCVIHFTNVPGQLGTVVIGASESSSDDAGELNARLREDRPGPGYCDTFKTWKTGYYCYKADHDFSAGQVVENRLVTILWFKGAPRLTTAQVRALMRDVDEHIQAAR